MELEATGEGNRGEAVMRVGKVLLCPNFSAATFSHYKMRQVWRSVELCKPSVFWGSTKHALSSGNEYVSCPPLSILGL